MRWTVLSGGAAWLAAAGLLAACAGVAGGPTEQRVAMAPISFNEIAGWGEDKQSEALAAFRRALAVNLFLKERLGLIPALEKEVGEKPI